MNRSNPLAENLGDGVPVDGLDDVDVSDRKPSDLLFQREFLDNRPTLEAAGFTMESYVAQRRVDEGIDRLEPRTSDEDA